MKLALSILCENPHRKTGLTTLFHEFVARGLKLFPEVNWLIFAGPDQEWSIQDSRVEVNRDFPANDQINRRLFADHFQVPGVARKRGADALLTVGFVPTRKTLPTAMHVLSLQHLDPRNNMGLARGLYRRWTTRFSWPKADLALTNSRFAIEQIFSVCPELAGRVVQSYEGLQHEQFNPIAAPDEIARLERKFEVRPGYFLWTSNFYPYKQAGLLIAGYAKLPAEIRAAHPLVMAGADWDNMLAVAREQVNELGIEGDVKFLGWVDDSWLAPLYRHGAAFCLASREETFGRCVIEAMACGTPCVVNDIPIMREVTKGHSLIIDFTNADALQAALLNAATDESVRSRLREAGIRRAADFTFEKLVSERIRAIRRMLASKKL
jgi:glycosyltransferase involved in cell wall biosynthesis